MAKHTFFPKLTRLKQGKAPSRIVQNSNFTHAAALRGRALRRFAASWAWIAFPGCVDTAEGIRRALLALGARAIPGHFSAAKQRK